jgi:outer membrane protein assembly factor BamB
MGMMSATRTLAAAALAVVVAAGLACKRNRPPDVPAVPTGPSICFKDTTYAFTTTATDPDGDSVAVRFGWGDSTYSNWEGWYASGDAATRTHTWPRTGTYEVRAWAMDREERESDSSGGLTVQVVLYRPPGTPRAPTGPDIGGEDSSYIFAAVAFHPDSASVAIRFSWEDGDTSDWSPYVASGESTRMGHVWSTPDTYMVAAQAKDPYNATSLWSTSHEIIIRPTDTLSKWRLQLAAGDLTSLYSSPAIGPDGTIYVGSRDSSLYAVNPDGTIKWRYLTGGSIRSSPAVAADGTVYVGSDDNSLYAIDPDGTPWWSYATEGNIRTSPVQAADGTVYVGSSDDYVYAIRPSGWLKWRYLIGSTISSSPAVAADGTVYVGSNDNCLYALNADSTLKWRFDTGNNINSSAAIGSDGTVYFGSDNDYLYALNPNGSLKWQYETGSNVESSPAIGADGTIYVGSGDRYFYALNPDGTLRWQYLTGNAVRSSPAVNSRQTVFFGSNDNSFYALNPDGTLKWRYQTGANIESAPNIGPDGTVYFTCDEGYLYALKGTGKLANSDWPKFHHDMMNTGRVGGGR